MSIVYADRVKETTTTSGTGTIDLAGAVAGFQSFATGIGNTNRCYYTIVDGTAWEVGIGTVTDASPDTLSRDSILDSSTGGSAISLSGGSSDVYCTIPANKVLHNFTTLFGDGSALQFEIHHELGTQSLMVSFQDLDDSVNGQGSPIEIPWHPSGDNYIVIPSSGNSLPFTPGSGQYRCNIIGFN